MRDLQLHLPVVEIDTQPATGRLVQAEKPKRFHRVQMAFAGSDDAKPRVRDVVNPPINRVGFHERFDRFQFEADRCSDPG